MEETSSSNAFPFRPMTRYLLPALVILLLPRSAGAQVYEDFSDLTSAWVGDTSRWQIGDLDGRPALQSRGEARSDTLYLALQTDAAYGRWEFVFAHRGIGLSNFNGARIFFTADGPDPSAGVRGYYLQLGTNNTGTVSLWRADGDLSLPRNRTELARSDERIAEADSSLLYVAANRDASGWSVSVNGEPLLHASDDHYRAGTHFIFWVKHSTRGAEAFFLADLKIEPEAPPPISGPPPTLPDTVGPTLLFVEQVDLNSLLLHFDEPLADDGLLPENVQVGGLYAEAVEPETERAFRARFAFPPEGSVVAVGPAKDRWGNATERVLHPIAFLPRAGDLVTNEILYEPLADPYDGVPDQVEYLELANRSSRLVTLSGLFRTRDPTEDGDADTLAIGKLLAALEPGALYVVHAGTNDHRALLDAFPPMLATTRIQAAPRLRLRNAGDRIRIHGRYGTVLDDVRYEPGWHHPDVVRTRGLALERIDLSGDGADPANWTSSVAPEGGTPGRPNSVVVRPMRPSAGRGLKVSPSPFSPDQDGHDDVAAISFQLSSDVALVRIRIFDLAGNVVREMIRSDLVSGSGVVYWDGRDGAGRRMRVGVYVVLLEAADRRNGTMESYKAPVVLARRW